MSATNYKKSRTERLEQSHSDKRWVFNDGGREEYGRGRQKTSFVSDCCVRAITIASKRKYNRVWDVAKAYKVKGTPSQGMYTSEWTNLMKFFCDIDTQRKLELERLGLLDKPLGDVIKHFRGGGVRYILQLRWTDKRKCGHVACVVGGKLHDTWDCKEMLVYDFWPVTPKPVYKKRKTNGQAR